jgi:outer membrane lipoprotein-sorting protein
MSNNFSRWIPAAVAVVVVAAGAIAIPVAASASDSLATKTPQQVLAMIGNSSVDAFSGTVKTTSNLGLPSLPSTGGAASGGSASTSDISSVLSLLSTSQSARVYVDGSKERVQVLSTLAEQDLIRNGSDLWQYDSKKNTVVHTTLPSKSTPAPTATTTPSQLADTLISKLAGSTDFSVGTSDHVASRSTYTLVLTPKAKDTLIGNVTIAVDSATGLPLEVSATARGQKAPAFAVAFDQVTLAAPDAKLFDFSAPKGAKVTEKKVPAHTAPTHPSTAPETSAKPSVVGTGWDAVVATAASADTAKLTDQKLFSELTTAVDGGRVFHTTLVNVLITTDGRVVAGSVSIARLQAVAAGK